MPGRYSRRGVEMGAVIDRIAARNLRPLALALGLYFGVLALSHAHFLAPPVSWWMTTIAGCSSVLLLALFFVARADALTRRAHLTIVVMAAVAMGNSLAHLALTGDPKQSTNIAIVIVGAGLLFYSRLWMAGFLAASIVVWLILSRFWPPDAGWVHYAFLVFSSTVLASLAFVVRMSGLESVEDMRAAVRQAEMEARLQELQKAESLGVLAGGVAHDLNNMLVGVLGNVDLAKQAVPPDSAAGPYLNAVAEAGERASELARQMLSYSGKSALKIEPVSLPVLVDKMRRLLRASVSHSIDLDVQLRGDIPPVEGDAGQLQQVVMNLVINAAEAIGERPGRILIRIEAVESRDGFNERAVQGGEAPPGRFVQLIVRDDGCGMDSATLERMFDPFYTSKHTGRGLGLASVSGIVRGHGGVILVDSRVDEGTCMTVFLPASTEPEEKPKNGAETRPIPVTGATVLVVDDEGSVRWVVRQTLRNAGFHVIEAKNGLEAVHKLRSGAHKIDLMLLDATMPGMTGIQTLEETRDVPVKVILMSGYGEGVAKHLTPNVVAFLPKPFSATELLSRVQEAIRQ